MKAQRDHRDHRMKIVSLAVSVLILISGSIVVGWIGLPTGFLTRGYGLNPGIGEAVEASVQMIGIACGSHLAITPNFIEAKPGGMIRITNDGPWNHEIHLSTKDRAALMDDPESRSHVIGSIRLQPGEVRDIKLPTQPGDYFLVAGNQWHYMAGLRGWVHVK